MTAGKLKSANMYIRCRCMKILDELSKLSISTVAEARIMSQLPDSPPSKFHLYVELKKYETARTSSPSN